jgi:sulfide:quinone oxidoreductase
MRPGVFSMAVLTRPRLLVLGGGFAGLEAAFYLRWRLGARADITLVSDRDRFFFKPGAVYVPFGLDPDTLTIPLERPTHRRGIAFVQARAQEIDPAAGVVVTDGGRLPYDQLIVATGATIRPEEIPGLAEHAETIWTPEAMVSLRGAFARLLADARASRRRRVLFLVPPNNKCAGPLYELAFMLDTWLHRNGGRAAVDIAWSTYEASFMQAFGPRLHDVVVSEFARRGVSGYPKYAADRVGPGEVWYTNGKALPYDLLVSFPPYTASTVFPGLPQDDRGFLQTDIVTREVIGHAGVYAVGDASDFPVKQAFLALLQADAVAERIAAQVLGERPAVAFDPVSICVLEEFDTATFAQVPLRLTGRSERPIEVRRDRGGEYRVGSSPAWRLGRKLMGAYLPWRFRHGNPFHAGLPWKGMELGLKVMSSLLAA